MIDLKSGDKVRLGGAILGTVVAVMGQYVKVRGTDDFVYEVNANDVEITLIEGDGQPGDLG